MSFSRLGAIAAADGVVPYVGGECSAAVSQVGGAALFAVVAVSDTPFRTGEPVVPGRSPSRSFTLRLTVGVTAAAFSHDVCPCLTINAVVDVTRYLVPLSRPHGQETPTESEGVVAVAQLALVNGWVTKCPGVKAVRSLGSSDKDEIGREFNTPSIRFEIEAIGTCHSFKMEFKTFYRGFSETSHVWSLPRHPIKRENVAWKAGVERLEQGSKWIAFYLDVLAKQAHATKESCVLDN
ncbi:hypothetical protein FF38_04229 [Lucilia cuprina]|uniref:Uncharacterized protein n=1 Tax=Lucilia cuprina TaxID=7375 RepID=A0A0L0C1G5_LUCCU|nr:hypothetical protein FF38_04229 [Lucilia cuprina]